RMNEPLKYDPWSSVLERTYLNFKWTAEAKKHTYVDREEIGPDFVEGAVLSYRNGDNNIQRCRANVPGRIIIQKGIDRNRIVRVVVSTSTNPW
ncbi:14115_t:CDS:1, partial [Funneliformis geosporum]